MFCKASPSGKGAGDAPLSIGARTGVYSRAGIDVELLHVGGGTGRIAAALSSGQVDFAVIPGIPLVEANLNGSELVMLLSIVAVNLHGVIGAKGITHPLQLKGKVLGGQGDRGLGDLLLRRALTGWGLDPDQDVTIRNVGDRPQLWSALEKGDIAAFAVTAPLTIQAEVFGYPLLHKFWEPPTPYQLGAICTRRQLIREQPDMVRAFMRGVVESTRIFQQDRALGLEHITLMTEVTHPEVLSRTYELFAEHMRRPWPNPDALQAVIEDVARVDPRAKGLEPSTLIDGTFLKELEGEGVAV
jgi:ABC-type nitrate/sulfonate/bicarbonate transport system substrate-binding protein